jgi:hypothetical protein
MSRPRRPAPARPARDRGLGSPVLVAAIGKVIEDRGGHDGRDRHARMGHAAITDPARPDAPRRHRLWPAPTTSRPKARWHWPHGRGCSHRAHRFRACRHAAHVDGRGRELVGQDHGGAGAHIGVLRAAHGDAGHVGDQVARAGAAQHGGCGGGGGGRCLGGRGLCHGARRQRGSAQHAASLEEIASVHRGFLRVWAVAGRKVWRLAGMLRIEIVSPALASLFFVLFFRCIR